MREIAVAVDDIERLDPRRQTIWVRTPEAAAAPAAGRIAAWLRRAGTRARTAQRAAAGGVR
jgi:hypothetical protein